MKPQLPGVAAPGAGITAVWFDTLAQRRDPEVATQPALRPAPFDQLRQVIVEVAAGGRHRHAGQVFVALEKRVGLFTQALPG